MPDATVILPGFFGKLPSMGDFVTRGLPSSFVGAWDRWISRHLVMRLADGDMDDLPVLRFILGADAFGPMAGVVIASADRAGRRFPLTIAAAAPMVTIPLLALAAGWFQSLADAGRHARDASLSADELAASLASIPFPDVRQPEAPHRSMAIVVPDSDPVILDTNMPGSMLDSIFLENVGSG